MNGKGDRNRSASQAYRDGWDRIFGGWQSDGELPALHIVKLPSSLDGVVFFGLDSAGNVTACLRCNGTGKITRRMLGIPTIFPCPHCEGTPTTDIAPDSP